MDENNRNGNQPNWTFYGQDSGTPPQNRPPQNYPHQNYPQQYQNAYQQQYGYQQQGQRYHDQQFGNLYQNSEHPDYWQRSHHPYQQSTQQTCNQQNYHQADWQTNQWQRYYQQPQPNRQYTHRQDTHQQGSMNYQYDNAYHEPWPYDQQHQPRIQQPYWGQYQQPYHEQTGAHPNRQQSDYGYDQEISNNSEQPQGQDVARLKHSTSQRQGGNGLNAQLGKIDDEEKRRNLFWDVLAAVCMFVVPLAPAGIYILWKKTALPAVTKWVASVIFGIFFLFWLFGGSSSSAPTKGATTNASQSGQSSGKTTEPSSNEQQSMAASTPPETDSQAATAESSSPYVSNSLSVGTYVVGQDLEIGKYNFSAIKGEGDFKIYKSYEDYEEDEYGLDSFLSYSMKTPSASVGLLNEDMYSGKIYNIRLAGGECITIDDSLCVAYEAATNMDNAFVWGPGIYVAGDDITPGKYSFSAESGTGEIVLYKSYEAFLSDEYGFDGIDSYRMKAEGADVGLMNEDVYTRTVSNLRILAGQCLIVKDGLDLTHSSSSLD